MLVDIYSLKLHPSSGQHYKCFFYVWILYKKIIEQTEIKLKSLKEKYDVPIILAYTFDISEYDILCVGLFVYLRYM